MTEPCGAIEFDNASFAYGDGRVVFTDLNLRIEAGERVGIVGPSGAGKSTLIGLVQRLDDGIGATIANVFQNSGSRCARGECARVGDKSRDDSQTKDGAHR